VIERFLGIQHVSDTTSPSLKLALETFISEDANDGDKKTQASGLIERMETFEYIFILHPMIRVLGKARDSTRQPKAQGLLHMECGFNHTPYKKDWTTTWGMSTSQPRRSQVSTRRISSR
jgi:hypothetical protein